jgi:hypothetical protein
MRIAPRARSRRFLKSSTFFRDPVFSLERDSLSLDTSQYSTSRTMLCMPVYDRRKRVFAVAQLLNKKNGEPFTDADEARFQEFAHPLGILLESCSRLGRGNNTAGA